jgi:hypothetical protein
MTEDNPKNQMEFQGEVKGVQVGDHNIIYNYIYYREEVKPTPVDAADEILACPYRGLFHFGPDDAEFFFGREVFVEELFANGKKYNGMKGHCCGVQC